MVLTDVKLRLRSSITLPTDSTMHRNLSSTTTPCGGGIILPALRAESKSLQRLVRFPLTTATYEYLLPQGFVFNLYDGVTGIVTHPYRDTKKDGVVGFGKGVGRGVSGLVLKTMAAVTGLPGYTLKGFEKQLEKHSNRKLNAQILKMRLMEGMAAFKQTTVEEREEILKRWKEFGVK
jgi:hypothetical protein